MATVTAKTAPNILINQTISAAGVLNNQQIPYPLSMSLSLLNGTLLDQCDLVASFSMTFVASTLQSLDMTNLVDAFGAAITTMLRVRLFGVRMDGTVDASTLTISPNGTNGWNRLFTGTGLILRAATAANPLGAFAVFGAPNSTGWAIDSTHKILDFTPSAHVFTIDGVIAGSSV